MVFAYIRVSTDSQTVENQRFEMNAFCKKENMKIDGWVEETISGTYKTDQRQLGALLKKVKKGDLILCAEISRLGRDLFMIMDILNTCMEKNCRVWTIKEGYRLGDDIQSKVLAFAFSLSAEIERTLISERTREALARKKAEGVTLGRPKGSCKVQDWLTSEEDRVLRLLESGISCREAARRLGCSATTLRNWLLSRAQSESQE